MNRLGSVCPQCLHRHVAGEDPELETWDLRRVPMGWGLVALKKEEGPGKGDSGWNRHQERTL